MILESFKAVEQSLKDKKDGEKQETAQKATTNRVKTRRFHWEKHGHVKRHCCDWLDSTRAGRAYAKENRQSARSTESSDNDDRDSRKEKNSGSHRSRSRQTERRPTGSTREETRDESSSSESIGKKSVANSKSKLPRKNPARHPKTEVGSYSTEEEEKDDDDDRRPN